MNLSVLIAIATLISAKTTTVTKYTTIYQPGNANTDVEYITVTRFTTLGQNSPVQTSFINSVATTLTTVVAPALAAQVEDSVPAENSVPVVEHNAEPAVAHVEDSVPAEKPAPVVEHIAEPAAAPPVANPAPAPKQASAPAPVVPAPATFSGSQDQDFSKQILDAHNAKRALHGASPLSWSNELYQYAQAFADKFDCANVQLKHSYGKYGENLAAGATSAYKVVDMWYNEVDDYNWSSQSRYDHFTQVVWKSTSKLGCAYKDCRSNNWGYYTVCSYDPAGNVLGQAKQNVSPKV